MKNDSKPDLGRLQNFREARVLVIESNASQMMLIEQYLNDCLPEVKLIKAMTEKQAMTYLNAGKADELKWPKLILLDILIPHCDDGWRMLHFIKELPVPANQIPVIIFSSLEHADVISEAYERGVASYLIKPDKAEDWWTYFQMIRRYWWETVSLPQTDNHY